MASVVNAHNCAPLFSVVCRRSSLCKTMILIRLMSPHPAQVAR